MAKGRKPIQLGPKGDAIVLEAARRGTKVDAVLAALKREGLSISRASLAERLKALGGRRRAKRAGSAPKLPTSESAAKGHIADPAALPLQGKLREPETIDPAEIENAAPATIEHALKVAAVALTRASTNGDLGEIARVTRNIGQLLAEQRKANAASKAEQNDTPEYRALGARVAAELHKMVDQIKEAKP